MLCVPRLFNCTSHVLTNAMFVLTLFRNFSFGTFLLFFICWCRSDLFLNTRLFSEFLSFISIFSKFGKVQKENIHICREYPVVVCLFLHITYSKPACCQNDCYKFEVNSNILYIERKANYWDVWKTVCSWDDSLLWNCCCWCCFPSELMISDRHQKREIRQLEQELPRWQVLVDSITGRWLLVRFYI